MSVIITQNDVESSAMACCPLCCESKPISSMCLLSRCSHENCNDCMVRWIEKAEAAGHKTQAECPFCRIPITQEEMFTILGRPFQPATMDANQRLELQELDDLTRHWLEEHVRPCPRCGACIEKIPGGCDMMECLCGFRFCYGCGTPGAECFCSPSTHSFWDNILDQHVVYSPPHEAAPTDTTTGEIDLKKHILERKRKDRQLRVHEERLQMWTERRREIRQLDEATSSAKWLFRPTYKASIRMLQQLGNQKYVRQQRNKDRRTREEESEFLDTRSPKARSRPPSTHREALNHRIRESDIVIYNATWLFLPGNKGLRVLKQQTKGFLVRGDRFFRRCHRASEVDSRRCIDGAISYGHWLVRGETSVQALKVLEHVLEQYCATGGYFRDYDCRWSEEGCRPRCRVCRHKPTQKDEKDNAVNLRLLFLRSEQEKNEETERIAEDWVEDLYNIP